MKSNILTSVHEYIKKDREKDGVFVPGETYVRTSGACWDEQDIVALVDVALGRWYTDTHVGKIFENKFSGVVGKRFVSLCNSGSSANLLAVSSLTSDSLGRLALKPGDHVITSALGFPTTVAALIQNGLVPVYVDVDLSTLNTTPELVRQAITPKTKAIILAHTLGNPFDAVEIYDLAKKHGLWMISDCCDALGASVGGRAVSEYSDIATFSFYPAHHISMGEGGAVATDNPRLNKIIRSFRDWGRDCWCPTGVDNTCGIRHKYVCDGVPYDHKYTYRELGYNFKATDLQASLGVTQLDKLDSFVERRRNNWSFLRSRLGDVGGVSFVSPLKEYDPSWFGFVITCPDNIERNSIVMTLESRGVGTRLVFAGNLLRQRAFKNTPRVVVGTLDVTDKVMSNSFWVGVWPGLTDEMLEYSATIIKQTILEKMDERPLEKNSVTA